MRGTSRVQHRVFLGVLLVMACARPPVQTGVVSRPEATLLGVRLVSRIGSEEDSLADASPKEAKASDTITCFALVQLALGKAKRETLYLSHTSRIRYAGPDSATLVWPVRGRLSIWNRLKQDIEIEWFEIVPTGRGYRPGARIRYRLHRLPNTGWTWEFTGRTGFRRLALAAHYGSQSVMSCRIDDEESVMRQPWFRCRADDTPVGWAQGLIGALPYREGSDVEQTANLRSCDSRALVLYGLRRLGYKFDAYSAETVDSLGTAVFQGYFRRGRLFDHQGKPVALKLGQDVRAGDVVRVGPANWYCFVRDDKVSHWLRLGGLPASLPILGAFGGFPEVRTLGSVVLSLPNLLRPVPVTIRRYPPIPVAPRPGNPRTTAGPPVGSRVRRPTRR